MRFLRSNTAVIVTVGPFYDKTDGVTIETGLTITNERITLTADTDDNSAPTNILDNVTGATSGTSNDLNYITGNDAGMMQLELSAANTNRVGRMLLSITDAANHVPVFHEFFVLPQAIYDWFTGVIVPLPANVTTWLGTAAATPTVAGVPEVDVTHWIGTAAATPSVAGVPEVDLTHVAGATTDVSALATNVAAILVDTGTTLDGRLPAALVSGRIDASVGAMASGVVTAAAVATGAIDADALAADAATEIRSLASGTSDSGTTTTMVDAARTEADTDYWTGSVIVFTSGNIAGQARVITGFTPASDTITFAPATTQAVSTQTYEIWPVGDFLRPTTSGRTLDVSAGGEAGLDWANIGSPTTAQNLSGTNIDVDQVVASVSGAVGSVTGLTAATVHSDLDDIQSRLPAALVAGRIDASVGAMAANVLTSTAINADAITAAKIADGAIDAATFAAGAINAAAIATGAIDADALAADAVDEILDEQIGDGTITMRQALRVLIAGMAGKLSGAATTTVTIRNVADSADVVVATVDANGNRSAVTVTP